MTRITRISLHGFKSFAHKTQVPFDTKYNCVLGPNGSGKSNIGDALCFVLGRLSAKSLRAEKTSHLIFNGAKSKKPSSAATVEIAFDNTQKIFPEDAPEVVISRTVTTKGTSVYRVNGKKRSRTEVLDLLAIAKINPDGYNIILQGDIMRFVDMPTVERRKILEEISDVSVYEEKKEKALREMEHVDEKLQNASVILKERKTYLKELEKDRNQALQFKEAKANIDACKATIIHLLQQEKEAAREMLEKEMGGRQTAIVNFETESTALKEKITKAKEAVSQLNKEIEQKGEKEQLRVHREVEELKVRMAQDKTRVSSLKDELNKIEQRKDQLQKELQDLQEKATSLSGKEKDLLREKQQKEREAAELEKHLAQFRKKHNLESSPELERSIDEKESRLDALQESVQKTRLQQQDLLREKDKLEYQLQTLDERLQKVKVVEKEQQEQVKALQQLKKELTQATLRLNSCLEQDSSFAAQMAHAKTKLQGLQEQQAAIEAKLRSVDADMHANPAVKRLLEQKKRFSGMEGTIAQLGRVDKKYARAVETAAGGKMQHLVVDTDKTAAQCIEFLKKEKLGVVSFIPLNKIKSVDITAEDKSLLKQQGAHDFALHLVTFPAAYKKAFAHVFGNTLVVADVEAARKIGVGRIRMSTLEGDSVMESGVMRGGFLQRSGGGFKERDSEELLERLEKESSQLQSVIDSVRTKREANEQEIAALRNRRSELEAEMVKFEKLLHLETGDLEATEQSRGAAQQRLKDVEKLLGEMQKGLSQQNGELLQLKEDKQQLRLKVTELRDPRLLAQLRAFEESKQQCREALLRIEAELKNAHVHGEQLVAPEQEKVRGILKQHDKEELQFRKEVEQLTAALGKQEKVLAEKEKASTQFYAQYRELFTKREKLSQEISSFENKVEQLREKARSQEKELNLVSLKNAEVKARLAGLDEELKRHAGVKLLPEKNVEKLQKDLGRFEIVLSQMSAVNLKALEIYEQIETEFNALVKKKDDLEKEKTDVLALMNEIESKKTEHFLKTFNQANENFQRIFSSLFTKGKAYLQLENQKDIFADGLSIKVRLSGNRFLDIKSLSGGEKTLTALAFIFAIQEYQPASFYVLDEIDAALDKHNSEKLAKLIRNYADRAQYILISHNDALISEADTLFGVSMQDGVSKVTSLKV